MDSSSQKEEEKKKITDVKTFPVPFPLRENQGNLTINTNTTFKPSREQIINQAFKFHSQGNILEAAKYYQNYIDKGFKDYRVFSNYGTILQNIGNLKEAELLIRKAIELNPNFAEAHSNLGNILKGLGKLKESELLQRKAIKLKPNLAEAHSNLGNILRDIGNLKEAELSTRKAIKIKPDNANAHFNLGNILRDLGKSQAAFDSYLKVIDINPKFSNIYPSITRFLKDSDPSQLNKSKLKYMLNLLLEKNDIAHKELIKAFNFVYSNEIISSLEKFNSDFYEIELLINNKVLINALKKIIFCDLKLEEVLKKVRRNICHRISKNIEIINESELKFIIALGEQCFFNEYIYSFTEEEKRSLNIIIKRCQDNELNETNISILSCYFPLYKLLDQITSLESFNSSNQSLKELIKLQIIEPLKEIKLSQNIKQLGSINDDVSQKVKSQYEENPYPRWRYGNPSVKQKYSIEQSINIEIKPNSINNRIGDRLLKVLVAGCGTGQDILYTQIYKNAEVTCIDLSLTSLSYAQRKIKELEINNVQLIQMDILEVNLLEEKFDIILCSGVLHHMDQPSKGLHALLGVLQTNGFLKLGLYSELARQNIIKARTFIASKKLQANEENIRNFRENIFLGETPALNSLIESPDFYTLSSCRDLCFHIQEHRFTLNQVQEILQSHELNFHGFFLSKQIKSVYKQYFPEDHCQINLQNWAKFEEQHPTTFAGMYQFWVSKISI